MHGACEVLESNKQLPQTLLLLRAPCRDRFGGLRCGLVLRDAALDVEPAELVLIIPDGRNGNRVLTLELALKQLFAKRILDEVLDGPAKRTSTEVGVRAF